MLGPEDRARVIAEIAALYAREPKLEDMRPALLRGYLHPPQSPDECIFAKTTACVSSDLTRRITPCQYGGDPDCTQCGCLASVGLQAIGEHKLGGVVPIYAIFDGSLKIGAAVRSLRGGNADGPARPGASLTGAAASN
jgi:hypothetical protein